MIPNPKSIKETRTKSGLTQAQAALTVHSALRTWQQWESGDRKMHPAIWELFCLKLGAEHEHNE